MSAPICPLCGVTWLADWDLTVCGRCESKRSSSVTRCRERVETDGGSIDVRPPVFGREGELTRLLTRYVEPGPSFLAVTGPAGIGKTRLLTEFRERLRERGGKTMFDIGQCRDHVTLPLEPFGDVLLSVAGTGRGDPDAGQKVVSALLDDFNTEMYDRTRRENFAHLLALSVGLDVAETRVTDLPPDRLEAEIYRAWLTWLTQRASDQPVVLQLEDIHTADQATHRLLAMLQRRLRQYGASPEITVIATLSPTERAPQGFEHIELSPLTEAETRTVTESVMGGSVSTNTAQFLYEQTDGNPYALEELLRYLIDIDLFEVHESEYGIPEHTLEETTIPEIPGGLLRERLEALSADEREVLQAGSVIGQQFWVDLLGDVLGRDVDSSIRTLSERGFVHRRNDSTFPDDDEYAFDHAVLCDTAYGMVPSEGRLELHAAISAELEARARWHTPVSRGLLALSARQANEAGDTDSASERWREAANGAREVNAAREAIEYDQQALALVQQDSGETVATLRANIAEIYESLGEYDSALETAQAGLEAAPDGSREQCRLLGIRADAQKEKGEYHPARETTQQQLEMATALEAREFEADALGRLGGIALDQGAYEQASEYYEEALASARECDDRRREATTTRDLGIAIWRQEQSGQVREYWERALEIARDLGDRQLEARNLADLGIVAWEESDYEQAREYYEQSLELKRHIGDRKGESLTLNNLGGVAGEQGDYDLASEYFERSRAIKRDLGDRPGEATSLNNLGDVARRRDDDDRAREYYEEALTIAREVNRPHDGAHSLLGFGALARRRGEYEQARTYLDQARELFETVGDQSYATEAQFEAARLALARGDLETARERTRRAQDSFEQLGETHHRGRCQRLLGRIATRERAYETAHDHYEASLETFEAVGAPQDILETLKYLVETCRSQRETDRAHQWCQRAQKELADAPEAVVTEHRGWVERHTQDLEKR